MCFTVELLLVFPREEGSLKHYLALIFFAGFIASSRLKSTLRQLVHRADTAVQFITIITTGTVSNYTAWTFSPAREMFQTASYSKNAEPLNKGKLFISLELSAQAFSLCVFQKLRKNN